MLFFSLSGLLLPSDCGCNSIVPQGKCPNCISCTNVEVTIGGIVYKCNATTCKSCDYDSFLVSEINPPTNRMHSDEEIREALIKLLSSNKNLLDQNCKCL